MYISSLRQELEQEGNTQFLLTIDLLERLIIARLSLIPQETNHFSLGMTNFDYLLGCWRRVIEASGKTTKVDSLLAIFLDSLDIGVVIGIRVKNLTSSPSICPFL